MLQVRDRLRRLLLAEQQPRPLELGGRRGRALPGHSRHFREQGERRPLLQGIQPDRDPARQQEDFGPAFPAPAPPPPPAPHPPPPPPPPRPPRPRPPRARGAGR